MLDSDIFGNLIVSGEDELNSYIPKFWKGILEMNANNYFAGYTLDRMAKDIQQMLYDRFFDSCSLAMLTRYEEFLKITNTDKMSVADRRAAVKMRWNGSGKMTGSRIRSIVKECCNCDCDVTFGSSQLIIDTIFKFEENPIIYVAIIRNMIENSTFPAHIEIVFRCNINLNIDNRNLEQVQLRRLNLRTSFLFWKFNKNNAAIQQLGCGIKCGGIPVKNNITNKVSCVMRSHQVLKEEVKQSLISLATTFQDTTGEIATSQTLRTEVNSFTESIEASVTTMKNVRYLNGSRLLDGSKRLNSEIKKEVL